jgi:intermembrane space import and assembly protein 40
MFKSAIRAAPGRVLPSRSTLIRSSRRFISTAPPSQKSRSWKSSAARWALAAGGIYYYNTSNVFAEEPEGELSCVLDQRGWLIRRSLAAIQRLDESIHHVQESRQPTIDAIVEETRQRQAQELAEEQKRQKIAEGGHQVQEGEEELEGLEEEADQQGAFNPETGEINWDCPCLGGMAHGPCGEEFKAAFSCFVYSNEEPKGVECIEKFK